MSVTKIMTPEGVTAELHSDLSLMPLGTRVLLLTHDLSVYHGYYYAQDAECVYLCRDLEHREFLLGIDKTEIVGWAQSKAQ